MPIVAEIPKRWSANNNETIRVWKPASNDRPKIKLEPGIQEHKHGGIAAEERDDFMRNIASPNRRIGELVIAEEQEDHAHSKADDDRSERLYSSEKTIHGREVIMMCASDNAC